MVGFHLAFEPNRQKHVVEHRVLQTPYYDRTCLCLCVLPLVCVCYETHSPISIDFVLFSQERILVWVDGSRHAQIRLPHTHIQPGFYVCSVCEKVACCKQYNTKGSYSLLIPSTSYRIAAIELDMCKVVFGIDTCTHCNCYYYQLNMVEIALLWI